MVRKKVLVANRSEIACRVFQTCRELNLQTVGIVAPGDEDARHVTYADEVHPVTSYLDIPSIMEVASRSKAHLVHPGYGFLSERSQFARSVQKAGLIFIGPSPETMDQLGAKISAKELAEKAQVPTLPWDRIQGKTSQAGLSLEQAAARIGYPLLLKASAGGGGKGMRKVEAASDLLPMAESATAEAVSAFGEGTLFLEKWVDRPRHIEVQIFGDGQGGGMHLYERECSLQRRHQKVWEESPAPGLSQELREKLCEAAVRMMGITQYQNAGTVEFLVDGQENFYFLEVNARLQVEHPVTELITGVDLVKMQILQALSPKKPALGAVAGTRGHAIEVRIYAEDPAQGFIPTFGTVDFLKWPTGSGIRVESGIEVGQKVSTQFDSMLAKLIVWAEDRPSALQRLRYALEETIILGVGTNQRFLRTLLDLEGVQKGEVDTGFIERHLNTPSAGLTNGLSQDELQWIGALDASRPGLSQDPSALRRQVRDIPSPWNLKHQRSGATLYGQKMD